MGTHPMATTFDNTVHKPAQETRSVQDRPVDRIWPSVVIAFGLALTGAWVCLLGYGLVLLVAAAI